MAIQVTPNHFTGREQALAAIAATGLRLVETDVRPENLSQTPHTHPYDVDIYILGGIMELHEPDTGRDYVLEAGTRALVPAGTLHWESSPGIFHAAFGLAVDRDVVMAGREP